MGKELYFELCRKGHELTSRKKKKLRTGRTFQAVNFFYSSGTICPYKFAIDCSRANNGFFHFPILLVGANFLLDRVAAEHWN